MSYCVNCGVKLDSNLKECPLCNTPIVNPKELERLSKTPTFPEKKGQVENVKRFDLGILITLILVSTSLSCLLLNLFVFKENLWSLAIIGICMVLFVMLIPLIIYTKLPIYFSFLADGTAIGVYLYLITFITPSSNWFFSLALPIVALVTLLVEIFVLLIRSLPVSYLTTLLYFFLEVAALCVGLELLIKHFLNEPLKLFWSAVVLTVCAVISVMLITVLSKKRLRDAVRRRLHF